MEERDYYEVLKVHPSADHAMIVGSYWHLARKCRAAMDRDAFAARALEELNQAYGVLGSADLRTQYDQTRSKGLPSDYDASQPGIKRLTIEVCFWNLPAWQGMLAATCTLALAAVALVAGARPLLVFCLAAATIVAALLVLPDGLLRGGIRRRWKREVNAAELQKSTAQILARWRKSNTERDVVTPLVEAAKATKYRPRS